MIDLSSENQLFRINDLNKNDYPQSDLFNTQSLSNDRPRPVSQKTSEEVAKILLFGDHREEFRGF